MTNRKERVDMLRAEAEVNPEVEEVLHMICTMAPQVLSNPAKVSQKEIDTYNQILRDNLPYEEMADQFCIKEWDPF